MFRILVALLLMSVPAAARDIYVPGYFRGDGTYVKPTLQAAPKEAPSSGFPVGGVQDPYERKMGTQNPYKDPYKNPYKAGKKEIRTRTKPRVPHQPWQGIR